MFLGVKSRFLAREAALRNDNSSKLTHYWASGAVFVGKAPSLCSVDGRMRPSPHVQLSPA